MRSLPKKRLNDEEEDLLERVNENLNEPIDAKNLGSGFEGTTYQFKYPSNTIAVKLYEPVEFQYKKRGGIGQFLMLHKPPRKIKNIFTTPSPYFAAEFLCAMEDFSIYDDYSKFIKKHPKEKKKTS